MLERKPKTDDHATFLFFFIVLRIQRHGPQKSIYENRMVFFSMKTYEHLRKSMKTYENL